MAELDKKYAVLIDADNVASKYIKPILDQLSTEGTITYKRIYGDWTLPNLGGWKTVLLENSITPIQQYGYTIGKNATDSAMIIDAMDILYASSVDGFCIVSSDSDFTRLASRLREAGKTVIGMGEKKTPSAFISACNKFKYLEILPGIQQPVAVEAAKSEKPIAQGTPVELIRRAMITIVDEVSQDDEDWIPLGRVGTILNTRFPEFDVRNYGFSKLGAFVKSLKVFEIQERRNSTDSNIKVINIRVRRG